MEFKIGQQIIVEMESTEDDTITSIVATIIKIIGKKVVVKDSNGLKLIIHSKNIK